MGKLSTDVRPGIIVLFFGFLGIIVAAIEQYVVDRGYLLDEYIAESITLPDLQIITVIFALLVGIVIAIVRS